MLMHVINSVLMGAVGTDLSCLFIHRLTKEICAVRMMMSKFRDLCRDVWSFGREAAFCLLDREWGLV